VPAITASPRSPRRHGPPDHEARSLCCNSIGLPATK
jgi:hypothetical protein